MKNLITFTLSAIILLGLTLTQASYAQQDPTGAGKRNQGQVKPNFVDKDGDGICDKNPTGTCLGNKKGTPGKGQGNGARLHRQLRNGSCENGRTPTAAPTGKTNTRRGQERNAAPNK